MKSTITVTLACIFSLNLYANTTKLSLDQALDQATSAHQNIFLYFNADWCLPCQIVKESVLSDTRITKTLDENFVHIEVDIDDSSQVEWTKKYASSCLPHFFVLDKKGLVLKEIAGSLPIDQFYQMLLQFSTVPVESTAPLAIEEALEVKEKEALSGFTLMDNSKVTNTILPADPVKVIKPEAPTKIMMNNVPVTKPEYQNNKVITIGAFKIESNAMNYLDKMRETYDFDIFIDFTNDGLFRLNIGNFNSEDEFNEKLNLVRKKKIDHFIRKV